MVHPAAIRVQFGRRGVSKAHRLAAQASACATPSAAARSQDLVLFAPHYGSFGGSGRRVRHQLDSVLGTVEDSTPGFYVHTG